jgi:amidohydrolase
LKTRHLPTPDCQQQWWQRVDAVLDGQVVEWRRALHRRPEVAFHEFETTELLLAALGTLGVAVERPLETGAVVRLRGAGPGPVIAVRADIDGLPVEEETGLPFASVHAGRMHACGHDGHMAIGLGLTAVLAAVAAELPGEVRVIFQPAEEILNGGAQALLAAGVLDDVDMVVGLHLWSLLPAGGVAARVGPVMAATDEFRIEVRGRGGHGAIPHQAVDPIVTAAAIIGDLQTVVSRRLDPALPGVVTVGTIHAGSAFNVIPDTALMTGTTRAHSATVRELLHREIGRVAENVARAHGAEATCVIVPGVPVTMNDPAMAAVMTGAIREALGPDAILDAPAQMAGDDFGFLAERVPGCYLLVGAGGEEAGATFSHHHPRLTIDERSLGIGLRVLLAGLQRLMDEPVTTRP